MLTQILLATGRPREVLELAATPPHVEILCHSEWVHPFQLAKVEALHALGEEDTARRELAELRANILERAARIHDPEVRRSYLENIPAHARAMALSAEWGA